MSFFSRLTFLGRFTIIGIITAIVCAILYFTGIMSGCTENSKNKEGQSLPSLSSLTKKSKYDATLVVNPYTGFAPIVWGNGGLEPKDDSYFAKKYGLKLKVIVMDDFDAARSALKNDDAQIEYCTLDALPVEMSSSGTMTDMKYFMLLNFSAGADALVANATINQISDLKGKRVAYAEGTASHTLLINALETSSLTMDDIIPVKVSSGVDAAQAFKAKQVDCAAVWSPDDVDCINAFKGAHLLTSTAQSNMLVSDGLIAKKEWLEKNKDLAAKIVEAILAANAEVTNNKTAFNEAAQVFAKEFETDVDFALASSSTINYASMEDQINWMGLNSDYSGMTGERIYSKMSRIYSGLGLCKSVLPWSKAAYTDIVELVNEKNSLTPEQKKSVGTAEKTFTAPTVKEDTVKAFSNKKVTINFPVNGFTLDNEARATIDREFVDIVQSYANTRIRIEGNTDATGNYNSNVSLSKKRAQAVVDYLTNEYKINRNRFVVVGNGPKHAIEDGVKESNESYRTTDLQLIAQ
ncbi:MAG: OmpA family protein [Paludibacteraceae bacterium]|nr:OmpA family protein [Paludibacteraceae bacterium]